MVVVPVVSVDVVPVAVSAGDVAARSIEGALVDRASDRRGDVPRNPGDGCTV